MTDFIPEQLAVKEFSFSTSPETDKLDSAMAKAQGQIGIAKKDKKNPHYKSSYADFAAVREVCREALASNGISVIQCPIASEDDRAHLLTRVACAGQWILSNMSIPVSKRDAQGYGSAISYLKRYCLEAVLGISTEEDDDGNAAVGKAPHPQPQPTPREPRPATPTVPPILPLTPPADYKIPFEKSAFYGQSISNIPTHKLLDYAEQLRVHYKEKAVPPMVEEFFNQVDKRLDEALATERKAEKK